MTDVSSRPANNYEFVDAGVDAIKRREPYLAGMAGYVPFLLTSVLAYFAIRAQNEFYFNPSPTEVLRQSGFWMLVIIVVAFVSISWAATAVGLQVNNGYGEGARLSQAASRLPVIVGAWAVLGGIGVSLSIITYIMFRLAPVQFVSFIVALLALPIGVLWVVFTVVVMVALGLIPALASSDTSIGSIAMLKRLLGLVATKPGQTTVAIVIAWVVSAAMALFGFLATAAVQFIFGALAAQMAFWGHTTSALLVGFWVIIIGFLVSLISWVAYIAMLARFARDNAIDPSLDAAADSLIGAGGSRLRRTGSPMPGADHLRPTQAKAEGGAGFVGSTLGDDVPPMSGYGYPERQPNSDVPPIPRFDSSPRVPDTSAPLGVAPPASASPSQVPPPAAPAAPVAPVPPVPPVPRVPQRPASSPEQACASCGASNPASYRFCRSCGQMNPRLG